MSIVKSGFARLILFILGIVAVVLGVAGIFLPLLPTTPFILLAAWCFLKSSERAHQWIYRQPILGQALREWEQSRAISRRTKLVALTMIVISAVFMWIKVRNLWIKGAVALLLLAVSLFIVTRNDSPPLK